MWRESSERGNSQVWQGHGEDLFYSGLIKFAWKFKKVQYGNTILTPSPWVSRHPTAPKKTVITSYASYKFKGPEATHTSEHLAKNSGGSMTPSGSILPEQLTELRRALSCLSVFLLSEMSVLLALHTGTLSTVSEPLTHHTVLNAFGSSHSAQTSTSSHRFPAFFHSKMLSFHHVCCL